MSLPSFTTANREHWHKRVNLLNAESQRQWGSLSLLQMLAHLTRSLEISLGEVEVVDESKPILRHVLYFIFFRLLPWPKGKIKTMPVFLKEPETDFDGERQLLLSAMDRFWKMVEDQPDARPLSPFLGPMPIHRWIVVQTRHMDHHLTQFGA